MSQDIEPVNQAIPSIVVRPKPKEEKGGARQQQKKRKKYANNETEPQHTPHPHPEEGHIDEYAWPITAHAPRVTDPKIRMTPVIILFIIVSVLLLGLAGLTFLLFQLKQEVDTLKRYHNKIIGRLTAVMKDLQNMTNATYGIGQQVNHINHRVQNLNARQDALDLREQSDKPVEQAIALLQKGADLEEIMQTCHLSRGEAELLFRIHGHYD